MPTTVSQASQGWPASRLLCATTIAALLVVAGCGGDDAVGEPRGGAPVSELCFELDADGPGGEPARVQTVRCPAEAGTEPTPLCAAVYALPANVDEALAPDVACTEIYGGPDVVRVEGTLNGEPIAITLTRADGCEIERFDRWSGLLRVAFPGYRPGEAIAP